MVILGLGVGNTDGSELFQPKNFKKKSTAILTVSSGERSGIRTHDLWLRRPTLYPAELPAHACNESNEGTLS